MKSMRARSFLACLVLVPTSLGMNCQGGSPLLPQVTLTASTDGKGIIELVAPEGNTEFTGGAFASGAVITLNARAQDGWCFVRWDGGASGSNPQVSLTLDSDKHVQAIFVAAGGLRTVTVDGIIGRMTLAVRDGQVRGNRRAGNIGLDIEGTLSGNQLILTSSAPGFSNSTISATVQSDGSLSGTINGSGYANSPFSADPVSLEGFDDWASGQRTTVVDGENGLLTVAIDGSVIRGTWRIALSLGVDVEGTINGSSVTFTVTSPGVNPATATATIQADGSWVGTIDGSGWSNAPFTAQPSFFP
ncbi:MAG: hypothetical protein DCC63_14745 [Nitrospira sp.]|nr:MAG: hypothetical protein DCC63_14745 [Nitrospira sp.]